MKYLITYVTLLMSFAAYGQQEAEKAVKEDAFAKEIESYIDHSVPTITVQKAYDKKDDFMFLDARELNEYKVSHIANAQHVGYRKFRKKSVKDLPRETPIVIYCSIGYRSEKIGKKLLKMGFTDVQNLYGSIFEWANQGLPIVDTQGQETLKVHTYDKRWSRWMTNETYQKVY